MAEPELRIAAGDRSFEERIQGLADQVHSLFQYQSIDLPDGSVLPQHYSPRMLLGGVMEERPRETI